ncbi:Non-heme 11 kDa protein of cytochrome bc1 complex [Lanmaoa asiatica]|nr:Non-heme 11 kDa protein of cytochrome bc1 complex [Lanmaoa asiatica]
MSLSSFFSSFLNIVHADAEEKEAVAESTQAEEAEQTEEEEPEDLHPVIRDECKSSTKCAPLTRHFEHCQEKVSAGQGYKGEDCVEELCMFSSPFSSWKPD